ncbi:10333_t:CDS:2, partial [Entrophospora sp. SA101]
MVKIKFFRWFLKKRNKRGNKKISKRIRKQLKNQQKQQKLQILRQKRLLKQLNLNRNPSYNAKYDIFPSNYPNDSNPSNINSSINNNNNSNHNQHNQYEQSRLIQQHEPNNQHLYYLIGPNNNNVNHTSNHYNNNNSRSINNNGFDNDFENNHNSENNYDRNFENNYDRKPQNTSMQFLSTKNPPKKYNPSRTNSILGIQSFHKSNNYSQKYQDLKKDNYNHNNEKEQLPLKSNNSSTVSLHNRVSRTLSYLAKFKDISIRKSRDSKIFSSLSLSSKKQTTCHTCQRTLVDIGYFTLWCQRCESKNFELNYGTWTTGNDDIDCFMLTTQINAKSRFDYLEWIPYDRLKNIEFIAQGGYGNTYQAIWLDGPREKFDKKSKTFVRCGEWRIVLKSIDNSKNINSKFFDELSIHLQSENNNRPHDKNLAMEICFNGLRPDIDEGDGNVDKIPESYLNLMKECWHADPFKRPTADELYKTLSDWLCKVCNMPTSKISMEFAAADNIKNQKTTKQMYNDENALFQADNTEIAAEVYEILQY